MMPTVIVPDAGPFFSLAAGDLLGILERFPLAITDVVKEETVDKGLLPGCSVEAQRLLAFYARHSRHVQVVETQVGKQLQSHRRSDPDFVQPRDLGELSIQSYLIQIHDLNPTARPMVLFEDSWFSRSARSAQIVSSHQHGNFSSPCRAAEDHSFRSVGPAGDSGGTTQCIDFCCEIDLSQEP